ncbi:hypothetical protein [Methanobrevibacter sp.]|uniref:hypothetical protein n=1 Tax=Methanobrevibacter sp. TaxID=66852 RepID=UPI00388FE9B5
MIESTIKEIQEKYDVMIKLLEEDKDSILVVIVYRDKHNMFARLPKDKQAIEQEVRKYWE